MSRLSEATPLRRQVLLASGLLLGLGLFASLSAPLQGAPPAKSAIWGATATFRCNGTLDATGAIAAACPDGIAGEGLLGDGQSYVGNPSINTTDGAFIHQSTSTWTDFLLKFDSTGRYMLLDFSDPKGGVACGKLACRKNFTVAKITKTLLTQGMLVRPVDAAGNDLVGGMQAIPVGSTYRAKIKMNFPDPAGSTLWYTLRFNPNDYPGSSYVYVTRTGTKTWTVFAGGNADAADTALAELVATTDGSRNMTHEGLYHMPFSLSVIQQ